MSVPYSLRTAEQTILEELRESNLAVIFSITNYNSEKGTIEYVLVSVSGSKDVPVEATNIVKKSLKKWKTTYKP